MPQSKKRSFVLPDQQHHAFHHIEKAIVAPNHGHLAVIDNHYHLWFATEQTTAPQRVSTNENYLSVFSACFSKDGQYLVFGDSLNRIFIFNINEQKTTHFSLPKRQDTYNQGMLSDASSLTMLANNHIVVATQSWGASHSIEIYDLQGKRQAEFNTMQKNWKSIVLSADETLLLAVHNVQSSRGLFTTAEISLFDMASKNEIKHFNVDFTVYEAKLAPDNKSLVCCGRSNKIQLWDIETSQLIKTLYTQSCSVKGIDYSKDGRYLAVDNSTQFVYDNNGFFKSQNPSYASIYNLENNTIIEQILCDSSLETLMFNDDRLLICGQQTIHSCKLSCLTADNDHTYTAPQY